MAFCTGGARALPALARLGDESRASQVHRVNDPESPAIKKARYGVIHWRVVGVNGAAVVDKAALVRALQAAPPGPVRCAPAASHVPL